MNAFGRHDKMNSRAVDRVNRIAFQLRPKEKTPNGRPKDDTNRSVISGFGIFDYTSQEAGLELGVRRSYREANDLRAVQVGRIPVISIDRKYFPGADAEPRQGDQIQLPTKPDLPSFKVVSVQRDGLSRLVLRLVHEGSQA